MEFSDVLAYITSMLITLGIGLLVELIRRMVGLEGLKRISWQLAHKKELAMLAVQFAQQAYRSYSGAKRLQQATIWMSARAAEHGISITSDEINGLIEAALRQIKDELGEEWANIVKEEEPPEEEAG